MQRKHKKKHLNQKKDDNEAEEHIRSINKEHGRSDKTKSEIKSNQHAAKHENEKSEK